VFTKKAMSPALNSLWIQIPAFNEESTIEEVISEIPLTLSGFKQVDILVIDDGSTDSTVLRVRRLMEKQTNLHLLQISPNRGLANAFSEGIAYCLSRNADVIVNTDGDGQYQGIDIPRLVTPILEGQADVVIGDRIVGSVSEFSIIKKLLQKFGSHVTSFLCGTKINDATSGFRSYNRKAASLIFITSNFTYTLESIVQLSALNMRTLCVPVQRNASTRPSRLFSSNLQYVRKNGTVLVRAFFRYKPARTLLSISFLSALLAFTMWVPSVLSYFNSDGSAHVQSTILGAVLMMNSFIMFGMAIVADAVLQNKLLIHSLHSDILTKKVTLRAGNKLF
jgi:glycosyltransferase involved in cell wall biosynthesis